ncbi:Heme peroxidase [Mycena indigotica]|uniref:Heme peroxidase n=1 Tax=Mycena indigotica TaxID=2126181 RepID=A0A8H6W9I4_9AGAR|nr:Heme peroxidase [Mycena indigotica]KAF7304164.1 Heme peroxidase [Mycena indigotica]
MYIFAHLCSWAGAGLGPRYTAPDAYRTPTPRLNGCGCRRGRGIRWARDANRNRKSQSIAPVTGSDRTRHAALALRLAYKPGAAGAGCASLLLLPLLPSPNLLPPLYTYLLSTSTPHSMTSLSPLDRLALAGDAAKHWLHRELPSAPDGQYDSEHVAHPEQEAKNRSIVSEGVAELNRLRPGLEATAKDALTGAGAIIDAVLHPNAVDDRKGAFTIALEVLANLPPEHVAAKKISDAALTLLYNTIPHPPATGLGPEHAWRSADGGGNNILSPDIGRAGTPYARSVQSRTPIAPSTLPDAGLVFDVLMRARDVQHHPGGNSSLTFAWATIVTHSLFRTDPRDWSRNNTSSYFDLSPLYGINQATQDLVRDRKAGKGLLYPDVFSEERLTFLPPAASAILVLFNRNHNYIAEKLLKINERGTWAEPPPTDESKRAQQDEEIFQIARLVNCGHFMSFIVGDYVAAFLGVSEGITSPLLNDAFSPMTDAKGAPVTRGEGNQCSVEFNVLYRWHALLSEPDREWTTTTFEHVFGDAKPLDELTLADFGAAFARVSKQIPPDPRLRSFGGLSRAADGRFADGDIAKILQDATATPAGSFRARGVQKELKVVEVLGIEQARRWGVCTMNEFREFLGLKRFESFEEWNHDEGVAAAARQLYGHVDNLELYVGLECEEIMPLRPGVRLSSGYTLMRAILADALALIRGDRFFTTDFTPWNLTAWGFQDCQRDPHNGALGGQMCKFLTRHLPAYYPPNSVYSCFPFFTPEHMKASLVKQKKAGDYTFTRPVPQRPVVVVETMEGIREVVRDEGRFRDVYGVKYLKGKDRNWLIDSLFPGSPIAAQTTYLATLQKQIATRSWVYDGAPGTYVDVVQGVLNPAAVRWAAEQLCGIRPKTAAHPAGVYTEAELFDMFGTLYSSTYLAVDDAEHGFAKAWAGARARELLLCRVEEAIRGVLPHNGHHTIADALAHVTELFHPADRKRPFAEFVARLAEARPQAGVDELAAAVLELGVVSCATYAQAAAQVVDFYLEDAQMHAREHIVSLVGSADVGDADKVLLAYVREALRLNPATTGVWRECAQNSVITQGHAALPVHVKAGTKVFGSLANAYRNPADFPDPLTVNIARPAAAYAFSASEPSEDVDFEHLAAAQALRAVFALKHVRRAAGSTGRLAGFKETANETEKTVYLTPYGTTSAFPGGMQVVYDA